MTGESVQPRDHPMTTPEDGTPTVVTTPQQVLTGLTVGPADRYVTCTGCQQARSEGQAVTVYAYRCADATAWDAARCYCPACAPTVIDTPTLGAAECLARATLGVRSVVGEQAHRLCLVSVEIDDRSPPAEGAAP